MIKLLHKYKPNTYVDSYKKYLKNLGQTKICVDFPSNSRVTFRSVEGWAMGALLIGTPICNVYPNDFKLEELIICKPDLSDFIEKIDWYLVHDAQRENITSKAVERWDKNIADGVVELLVKNRG